MIIFGVNYIFQGRFRVISHRFQIRGIIYRIWMIAILREREVPPAGRGGGGDSIGVSIFEQSAQDPPVQELAVPMEEFQMPTGLGVPLGTIPEVEDDAGGAFTEKSWAFGDFVFDQYERTPTASVTATSSIVCH